MKWLIVVDEARHVGFGDTCATAIALKHVIITYILLGLRLKVIFLNLVGLKSNVLMF